MVRITPEFTTRITTNSLGFRGPELGTLSRRPILFLGDSFTLGYGVGDGEEFPALVRRALAARGADEIPVINAGLGHNGNGRAVKFLRTEGPRYDPALVVLQLHHNDLWDNIRDGLFDFTPDGALRERPVPRPSYARRVWESVESVPVLGRALSDSYPRAARCAPCRSPTEPSTRRPGTSGAIPRRACTGGSRSCVARVVLGPGAYAFCGLKIGRDSVVEADATTVLLRGGSVRATNGSTLGQDCADLTLLMRGNGVVTFGRHVLVAARVCAPQAFLRLGHGNTLIGQFVGERILADSQNQGRCCCPEP